MGRTPDTIYKKAQATLLPYPAGVYVRNDDPLEYVRIRSQEKTLGGQIEFEFLAPESVYGRKVTLTGDEFHRLYHDPHKKDEEQVDPKRPSSLGTKEEWRTYALWLEERYHRPKPPVYRNRESLPVTILPDEPAEDYQ